MIVHYQAQNKFERGKAHAEPHHSEAQQPTPTKFGQWRVNAYRREGVRERGKDPSPLLFKLKMIIINLEKRTG